MTYWNYIKDDYSQPVKEKRVIMEKSINNFRKVIVLFACTIFLLIGTTIAASAKTTYFTPHTITNGSKMYYYHDSSAGFKVSDGNSMSMSYTFTKEHFHSCGYRTMSTSTDSTVVSGTGSWGTMLAYVNSTGNYKTFIKNSSGSTISVSSGYISN